MKAIYELHGIPVYEDEQCEIHFVLCKDMPKDILPRFNKWIYGQTCGIIPVNGKLVSAIYIDDWDRFARRLPVID